MLRIQEFLRCFEDTQDGLQRLRTEMGIHWNKLYITGENSYREGESIRMGPSDPRDAVYHFNLTTDKPNTIAREADCLGLYANTLEIAYWSGYLAPEARTENDWGRVNSKKCIAREYVEGTTLMVYYHNIGWKIANKNSPNGFGMVNVKDPEWNDILRSELGRAFSPWWKPFKFNKNVCFVFKYVKEHGYLHTTTFPNIVLVNMINRETGEALPEHKLLAFASTEGLPRPNIFRVRGKRTLSSVFSSMWPLAPGLVFRDKANNYVFKNNPVIKAVANAREAHKRERLTPIHLAKIVLACPNESVLDRIALRNEDFSHVLYLLQDAKLNAAMELAGLYSYAKELKSDRDFAKFVNDHPLSFVIFAYRKNVIDSISEGINNIKPEKLLDYTISSSNGEFQELFHELKTDGGNS